MDVDPWVKDLTSSEADAENTSDEQVVSSLSGLSSNSGSSGSDLYNDSSQTFLSVTIIDIDEDPAENSELLPVPGPILAILPGLSILRSLILIEEEVDLLNNLRFIPPSLCGDETAGLDVDLQEEEREAKEEEPEGKVAGTPEFCAGDYE